jgi:hypothetical protein
MKKLSAFIVAAVVLTVAAGVNAANYNDAGCGLGSMIFPGNGKGQQILAGTTNGIGSQTSGISSQTSDCRERGVVKREKEREVFVAVNFRDLSRELAAGEGEYAKSFAWLMGCGGDNTAALLQHTKKNYDALFPKGKTTPKSMLKAVETEVAGVCTL